MRILVSGDWHLGKIIYNQSLLEDQVKVIAEISRIAVTESVDLIILTGDIYDRAIPPKEAVIAFESFVVTMVLNYGIKVVVIAGNHDSQERLSFGHALLSASGLHIAKRYQGTLEKIVFHDEHGPLNLYLVPFAPYQETRLVLEDDTIVSFQDAYQKILEREHIEQRERNVLITHAFVVYGAAEPEQSDSEKILSIGGIDHVDAAIFDAFDEVLLGHIHKPQKVGKETIRYTGSIMKYSFSEANHHKSVMILKMNDKGEQQYTLIALTQSRDMAVITGSFDEIMNDDQLLEKHKGDYVSVVLTDSEARHEPFARLKAVFPHILEMRYETREMLFDDDALISRDLIETLHDNKHDSVDHVVHLFRDFAEKTVGYEITDDDCKLIRTIVKDLKEEGDDR